MTKIIDVGSLGEEMITVPMRSAWAAASLPLDQRAFVFAKVVEAAARRLLERFDGPASEKVMRGILAQFEAYHQDLTALPPGARVLDSLYLARKRAAAEVEAQDVDAERAITALKDPEATAIVASVLLEAAERRKR
jgi:hypothetical protein